MMSPDKPTLEEMLCLGGVAGGAELNNSLPNSLQGLQLPDNITATVSPKTPALAAVSIQEPIMCTGCGEQVCERFFLLATGRVWHNGCLRCSQCQCDLQTHHSLYCRDGNIYCLLDYCRMFGGGQCARCLQPIPGTTLVMRSDQLTFHLHCFSCQECEVQLTSGNLYGIHGHNLYCHTHYNMEGAGPQPQGPCTAPSKVPAQVQWDGEESVSSSSQEDGGLEGGPEDGRTRRQNKRIRTCFRSEQLKALESYFAQKHNPSGNDWSCLTNKTGLPKRVLQVWFQNARAKLRRSLTADSLPQTLSLPSVRGDRAITEAMSQSEPSSTIDQLQLSMLTAPLSPLTQQHQQNQHRTHVLLDCASHGAPGCSYSSEAPGDSALGGARRVEDEDNPEDS